MAKHYPALWGGRTDWTSPPRAPFTTPASAPVVAGEAEGEMP
jgi:hypothetical protein